MTTPSHAPTPANFNRLVRIYRALEFTAFGRDLERVRFCHLAALRDCRSILILGEGDGRFLAQLVAQTPTASIHCIDASPAMLAAAAHRLPESDRNRVTFTCADALTYDFSSRHYDAVVTLFFLDCFSNAQIESLVAKLTQALRAPSRWVFGDFVLPPKGWPRLRARLWLAVLYTFFRWQTGLQVKALPDSEAVLARAGFKPQHAQTFQHGLLRAVVFRRE